MGNGWIRARKTGMLLFTIIPSRAGRVNRYRSRTASGRRHQALGSIGAAAGSKASEIQVPADPARFFLTGAAFYPKIPAKKIER
jgi:hypothetical protein